MFTLIASFPSAIAHTGERSAGGVLEDWCPPFPVLSSKCASLQSGRSISPRAMRGGLGNSLAIAHTQQQTRAPCRLDRRLRPSLEGTLTKEQVL